MNLSTINLQKLGYSKQVIDFVEYCHNSLQEKFNNIDKIREYNQARIMDSFSKHQISQRHFNPSTGYGYDDESRDTLDKLFATIFGGEDAIVRPQWASGTHVLSDSMFGLLRPGKSVMSITGKPYDTLESVIGIGDKKVNGSLKEWGIKYYQCDMTDDKKIDYNKVVNKCIEHKIDLILIQRSRGYEWRNSLSINDIKKAIVKIKNISPNTIILVDNCYGEFTEPMEPCHVGADIAVGSLIKNPGGGIAPTGAYVVGRKDLVNNISYRQTSPGIGREVGSYMSTYMPFYQGIFMAPNVVSEAIKGSTLIAKVFEEIGYSVLPKWNEERSDIIQSVEFKTADELIGFCQDIQSASPVDSHVIPYPWDMPGYSNQVIMAAGTFVQGASIELSADAPIKSPYIAYIQGGLTYSHVKIALMKILMGKEKRGEVKKFKIT